MQDAASTGSLNIRGLLKLNDHTAIPVQPEASLLL